MNTFNNLIKQSEALTAKARLMTDYVSKMAALEPVTNMAWDASEPYEKRKPVIEILRILEKEATAEMVANVKSPMLLLEQKVDELEAATVENKRKVLQTIPIVIVPVAAMYLGVKEAEVHRFKYSCKRLFGARYMGRQCYSMEELYLIAKNPEWMWKYTYAEMQAADELPDMTALDDFVFVDEDMACAYTNMSEDELRDSVRRSYRDFGSYRLSDLEKIRVAKLNGQQH